MSYATEEKSAESGALPRAYHMCSKTIMDTSDPFIEFSEDGVCNHVRDYYEQEAAHVVRGAQGQALLKETSEKIGHFGKGRRYDCILGLSGGVDSTYLCLLAKEMGLRPLVVHFDNGWNSELAVNNIENTIQKLGFDLYTYVVDWAEFRDLQRSYFRANVVDIEVLTDHGFMAVLYRQAKKHKIKYVLGGMNVVTEAILPRFWIYDKSDVVNMRAIQKRFGTMPIRSFPTLSPFYRRLTQSFSGLEVLSPLNWVEYKYADVKARITEELNWRDYGGKHYESVFTRFYQGYILPNKFGFDKRRAHLSTLICSGQLSRDEALAVIADPGYDEQLCQRDRDFALKKLGFSPKEFDSYMAAPRIEHAVYGAGQSVYAQYPLLKPLRPLVQAFMR